MPLRRLLLAALAAPPLALASLTAPALVPAAVADPVPAPYAASAHADVATVTTSQLSGPVADLLGTSSTSSTLGHALADLDSTSATPTTATSSNLEAGAAGLGSLTPDTRQAQTAGGANPSSDTDSGALADVPAAPVLDASGLTADTSARWAGSTGCVDAPTPLSQASTTVASARTLDLSGLAPLPALTVARTGAATSTATTSLLGTTGGRSVVSTAQGTLAGVDLLGGAVHLDAASAQLTATSDGDSPGHLDYTAPVVTLTHDGTSEVIDAPGESRSVTVPLVSAPGSSLDATVTVTLGAVEDTGTGTTAVGSVEAIGVDVTLTATGLAQTALGATPLAAHLALMPLSARAAAPAGGVECSIAAPTITYPTDGATTDAGPTITGTGLPGATVRLVLDGGTPIDVPTDAVTGAWSHETSGLAVGDHDVVATQSLDGLSSAQSNHPSFTVAASTPPDTTPGTTEPGTTAPGNAPAAPTAPTADPTSSPDSTTAPVTVTSKPGVVSTDDPVTVTSTTGTLADTGAPAGARTSALLGLLLVAVGSDLLVWRRRSGA